MGRDNSQEADGPSGHFLERQRSMRWRGEAIIPLLISEPCTLQSYFHPHILKTSLQQGRETEALTGAMTCAKAQSGRAEMGGLTCPLPHPQATPWSLRPHHTQPSLPNSQLKAGSYPTHEKPAPYFLALSPDLNGLREHIPATHLPLVPAHTM